MNIKIFSGEKEIVDSGSVILFNKDSNLEFDVKNAEYNFNFTLKINFIDNGDEVTKGERNIKAKIDGNIINLTCYNFNNTLGTAPVSPYNLATIGGRELYLNFIVYQLSEDSSKHIIYTFYSGR